LAAPELEEMVAFMVRMAMETLPICGGQVAADVDCCGSSNPSTLMFYSPEKAAASAVANVWKENPASSSRLTSGFVGGIE
jgi:hypothetical protein